MCRRPRQRTGVKQNHAFAERQGVAQGWAISFPKRRSKPADKPGSVVGNHSSGTAVTSSLMRPTRRHRGPRHGLPIWSCSGWGLPSRSVLPPARCALTAPFHPYRALTARRFAFCCTFRRLAPPRRYLAPCPAEPGLSSPGRTPARLPGWLRGVFSGIRAGLNSPSGQSLSSSFSSAR